MNSEIAIKVENVSKKYCKTLKKSMLYGVTDIIRNMLGFGSNPSRLRSSEFWAVDDISFEVKKGETLGLIGPNGSGKTTFLKMLNGIFWPDKGKISIRGNVGALIAVGAGFHPMLTGRENIFLNAAILGMTRREIQKKFDAIVDFSGVESFLDTPVKYYSSGMFVRLGFSIAAHCEPDILLIDEVLSVGDAEFKAKSLAKMVELIKGGKSVVFVSHHMPSVAGICNKVIYMNKGVGVRYGNPDEVIDIYENDVKTTYANEYKGVPASWPIGGAMIKNVYASNSFGEETKTFGFNEIINIEFSYELTDALPDDITFAVFFYRQGDGIRAMATMSHYKGMSIQAKNGNVKLSLKESGLAPSDYVVDVQIRSKSYDHPLATYRIKDLCIKNDNLYITGAKPVFFLQKQDWLVGI